MTEKTATEKASEHAAERRADYVRALDEERDMCERQGKVDRVKAIDAELKRVKSAESRKAPAKDNATA